MKRIKKKILAVLMLAAVMGMILTGCGSKLTPADRNVNALAELLIRNDPAPAMEIFGIETEEDVYNAFMEDGTSSADLVVEMQGMLEELGVEISGAELQGFSDALYAMLDKVQISSEITSQGKDEVVVTVKVNGILEEEFEKVIENATEKLQENVISGLADLSEEEVAAIQGGDMTILVPYIEQYLKDAKAGISDIEPVAEAVEVQVPCEKLLYETGEKEKTAWLPSDMQQFEDDLMAALYQ